MSIQINLEVDDVNVVLEGLKRIADNAIRIGNSVRVQGNEQFDKMLEAERAKQQADAAQKNADQTPPAV